VHLLLMARAAALGSNVQGSPVGAYDNPTADNPAIDTNVQYAVRGQRVVLDVVASAAPAKGHGPLSAAQAISQGSPCGSFLPGELGRPTGCVRTRLAGGAQEWTYETVVVATGTTVSRTAAIVATDGSSLSVTATAPGGDDATSQLALPALAPTSQQLLDLGHQAVRAWRTGAAANPVLAGAPVGPFDLTHPTRVASAAKQVYTLLTRRVGSSGLVQSNSAGTWLSPSQSAAPDLAGQRVLYRIPAGTLALTATVAAPLKAPLLQDWLASGDPCAGSVARVHCVRTPLPGGAELWTFATVHPGTGVKDRFTDGRSAVVLARDGSMLSVDLVAADSPFDLGSAAPDLDALAREAGRLWTTTAE
jgi:hypothetical protein